MRAAWVTGSIKNDGHPGGPELCPDWEVHVRNIVKQSGDLDIFWSVNKRINLPGDQLDLTCSPLFFFLSMQILIMFIILNEILQNLKNGAPLCAGLGVVLNNARILYTSGISVAFCMCHWEQKASQECWRADVTSTLNHNMPNLNLTPVHNLPLNLSLHPEI